MAKNQKTHKALSAKQKSLIAFALLLVVTLVVSYFGIAGAQLGPEESRKLLPYMPMNAEMDAYILPVDMAGGKLYEAVLAPVAEGQESQADKVVEIFENRLAHFGLRGYKVEKVDDELVHVTIPSYADTEMIGTLLSTTGNITFTDAAGNVLLSNEHFTSTKVVYANGYYFIEMRADKAALKAATEATLGSTMNINLDGSQLAAPSVDEVNGTGALTVSLGLVEGATRTIAALLVNEPLPVVLTNVIMNDAEATAPASLNALLIALWVMFAVAVVLMVIRYRVAGIGAAWALWAYALLFFFLMCTVTRVYADVTVWIAVFAGVVLVVAAFAEQLKAMRKAVAEGRDARAAVRLGLNTTVKRVLVMFGAALVVALVLMILSATRPMGYTLATAVVAGLCATQIGARVLVPVMVSLCGGKACTIGGCSSEK